MTDQLDHEDQIILSILDEEALEVEADTVEEAVLRRTYSELVGLLPQGLTPVEPRPEARERLMRALRPADRPVPADLEPAAAPSRVRWPMVLAATASIVFLGLSLLLWTRLQAADARYDDLVSRVSTVESGGDDLVFELARLHFEMEQVAERIAVTSARGVEACPLMPVGAEPVQPKARGVLYVAGDHQHWYLKATGLEPPPVGTRYQVWFETPGGPVYGGELLDDGEIASPTMPAGTRAVLITLEEEASPTRPQGPRVLYGAEKMTLL